MKNVFFIMAFLFCLNSCGEDVDADPIGGIQAEEVEQPSTDQFFTRLTNTLSFRGFKCLGNELVLVDEGETVQCEFGQWVVTVDQTNVCANGSCTQDFVFPFMATMNKVDEENGFDYFEIKNVTEVDANTTNLISLFWVRFEGDEQPVVLEKL